MKRFAILFLLIFIVTFGQTFALNPGMDVSLGAGFQNSYTKLAVTFDGPVGGRSRLGGAIQGFYAFSDRSYNDIRYNPAALAIEPYWKRYGRTENRNTWPYLLVGIPVGTVIIPSPYRAGNNLIGGVRFAYGLEFILADDSAIFLEASLGAILHFVFGDSADDPYSTDIDSFSGFGISAGYRF